MSASRVAGQQGTGNTLENKSAPAWRIEFETRAKWQNPLQGWNSTADPLENVGRSSLFFFTKEQAVAYAEKAGWEVEVVEPNLRRKDRQKRYNSYGDNYTGGRAGSAAAVETFRGNSAAHRATSGAAALPGREAGARNSGAAIATAEANLRLVGRTVQALQPECAALL
jgi:NADH dehydrogenase (ubiquinone) Fe-S protein 4